MLVHEIVHVPHGELHIIVCRHVMTIATEKFILSFFHSMFLSDTSNTK